MHRDSRFKRSRSRKYQRQNPRFKDRRSPRYEREREPRRRQVSEERILLEETRKYERRMGADKQPVKLHIADNFEELSALVKSEKVSELKRVDRLPSVGERMFNDILQTLNDQEVAYVFGGRYLKLMDHVFKYSSDKNFIELRYGGEYRKVRSIMTELETELKVRYEEKIRGLERARHLKEQDASELAASELVASTSKAFQLPEKPVDTGAVAQQLPLFDRMDISSVDLYGALMKKMNVLIVDMRSNEDFMESHIMIEEGHLINIPEDIVVPGLSAHTLGQRLSEETQKVWNQRDNFDVIILLDWETDSFNFSGSKLERLRNCIVKWDFNRKYVQQPVVLSGGFKEFLECYPTEVTNSHAFLSQTNSEIDDLLTIDDVSYPDPGSAGTMNLKPQAISSFVNVDARVERDFGDLEVTPGPAARPSRSEGQLPKDFYSSKAGISAYKSLSQESLPKDYNALDAMVEPLSAAFIDPGFLEDQDIDEDPSREEVPVEVGAAKVGEEIKISDDDEVAQIKSAIEDEKAELLNRIRALKPKSPRDSPEPVFVTTDPFVRPARPPKVDRTFKPARVLQVPKEGYTGMKNVRNNCYISCMMQCIKVLPFFKSMFATSDTYIHHIHKHPPVVTLHFAAVMKALWEGTSRKLKSYYPQVFLDKVYHLNPVYAKGNHEDTFEFFILLFNNLSDDCSVDMPRPKIMTEREKSWFSQLQGRTSYFVDLFYYQLKNTKICWHCQKPNYVFDSDSTIMVSISEKKEENTVEFLLKEYLKENLIEDYSCADCKHAATIVNRKEIVLDPEILIIILKRYSATNYGSIEKNESEIWFPADGLVFGSSYYKLYAIPQHSGSMSVGHYFASVLLNDTTNTWVQFNDERVSKYTVPITEVPRIRTTCVGFFYVRQKRISKL